MAKQESVEATATKQGQPASQANWSNGGNLVWKTRKTSQPTLDTAPYCSNSFVRQQRSLQKWNLVWKTRKTAQPTIHTAPYCSNSFVRLQRSIQKWLQWSAEITAISACAAAHEDLMLFQGQRSRELDQLQKITTSRTAYVRLLLFYYKTAMEWTVYIVQYAGANTRLWYC